MKRLFFILIIIIMLVMISKYNIQNEHKIIEVSQEGFAISLKSAHAQYASYKDVDIKATIRYINDDSITYRVSKPFYFMIVSDIKGNIVDRLEPIDVAIDYTFEPVT